MSEIELLQKQLESLQKKLDTQETMRELFKRTISGIYTNSNLSIPTPSPTGNKNHQEIRVLHLSDIQYGKITATYNPKIAHQRLMNIVSIVGHIIEAHRTHSKIERLHLYLGGDIIEGHDIFPGQGQQIAFGSYRQAKGVSESLAALIIGLLKYVKRIKILCVPGNHGRIGKDDPDSNWDTQVYDLVKLRVNNPRIEFPDPGNWYQTDRILDWGTLLVHGHQIQGSGAGFPLNGVTRKAMGWIDSIAESWDYLFFGHFHTLSSCVLNHRVILSNGSPESDNTYAQETMAATGSPVQRLCFFDKKHGMIADYPLYLDGRKPNRK